MKRWLVLALALTTAAAALYALVAREAPDEPPGHIDAASRESLERVLRDADRAEASP